MSDLLRRPPAVVAFRPERVNTTPAPSAEGWTMKISGTVSFISETLLEEMYSDRRKCARKIRQQRRKLRRLNAEFGHGPCDGVSASLLRARIVIP